MQKDEDFEREVFELAARIKYFTLTDNLYLAGKLKFKPGQAGHTRGRACPGKTSQGAHRSLNPDRKA